MDVLLELIAQASRFTRSHLDEIALALVATLCVLFGPALNAWVQRTLGNVNFVLRTVAFVSFCALVYGAGIALASPLLAEGLGYINNYALVPVLLLIGFFIGVIAEQKR